MHHHADLNWTPFMGRRVFRNENNTKPGSRVVVTWNLKVNE
jgi:hypothetical protein